VDRGETPDDSSVCDEHGRIALQDFAVLGTELLAAMGQQVARLFDEPRYLPFPHTIFAAKRLIDFDDQGRERAQPPEPLVIEDEIEKLAARRDTALRSLVRNPL